MPLLLAARKPCGWALGHSWTLGLSLSPSEISGGWGWGGCFFFFWLCQVVGAALQLHGMWDLVP